MSIIKSYTDIEQSKNLAKMLPLESADMSYRPYREEGGVPDYQATLCPHRFASWIGTPCWSLAALLNALSISLNALRDGKWNASTSYDGETIYEVKDNPIDACYKMILKLHELKLL